MAAITTFFEHKAIYENVKPYAWDGEESELFPKTNFVLKEMEASLFTRKASEATHSSLTMSFLQVESHRHKDTAGFQTHNRRKWVLLPSEQVQRTLSHDGPG